MSEALYEFGGLRFWAEEEIELRNLIQARIVSVVKQTLLDMNSAWVFKQVEGPCLIPKEEVHAQYMDSDVFVTNHKLGENYLWLRPETTQSSYTYAKHLNKKLPLCVYQSGKSFRRELNDGATASKLRFNEFWQLEFQAIYNKTTKADYREALIKAVGLEVKRFTGLDSRCIKSERIPSYSESTLDIEALWNDKWMEVVSCSIRTDYSEDTRVCEIAVGLDRLVTLAMSMQGVQDNAQRGQGSTS